MRKAFAAIALSMAIAPSQGYAQEDCPRGLFEAFTGQRLFTCDQRRAMMATSDYLHQRSQMQPIVPVQPPALQPIAPPPMPQSPTLIVPMNGSGGGWVVYH